MSNTKKIALMSTLVLLLAVTAVFNFVLAGTGGASVSAGGSSVQSVADFFEAHRTERAATRSEELMQCDAIISAYAADSAEYAEAVAAKQKIVSMMENELYMETVIRSIGFADAVVLMNAEKDNVSVFVNSGELDKDSALRIMAAFESELGIRGNVAIVPILAES